MPIRSSAPIEATPQERQELRNLRRGWLQKRDWVRADIALRVAGGQSNLVIARELRIS